MADLKKMVKGKRRLKKKLRIPVASVHIIPHADFVYLHLRYNHAIVARLCVFSLVVFYKERLNYLFTQRV